MKILRTSILGASCVLLAAVALPAQAAPVFTDEYWGAGADVECLSNGDTYCISGADVGFVASTKTLTVTIYTTFAGLAGTEYTGTATATPAGMSLGIGYGDLFLSSTYSPYTVGDGSPTYKTDNAGNGNEWTYGLALDADRWTSGDTGGTASLYTLAAGAPGTHNPDALLSDDFMNLGTSLYRNGQEVAVNTSTAGGPLGNTGSWAVDDSGNTITFSLDLTGTDLLTNLASEGIAFHWGMTCANDTIEVDVAPPSIIPVPASLWLMGSGLLGLVSIARRRKRA